MCEAHLFLFSKFLRGLTNFREIPKKKKEEKRERAKAFVNTSRTERRVKGEREKRFLKHALPGANENANFISMDLVLV